MADDSADAQTDTNQDVVPLGGKRSAFVTPAKVIKVLRPARSRTTQSDSGDQDALRKTRSDAGQGIDPAAPPKVIRTPVSLGGVAGWEGLPPLDVTLLERVDWSAIGDLGLLADVLRRIERNHPTLTLSLSLVNLKRGSAISLRQKKRRACLVAVFTALHQPPRVVLDVDHTDLETGLSGQMLVYDRDAPMAEIESHIKQMLDGLVDRYGHWDAGAESNLPDFVTVHRLAKLLRMQDRAEDAKYVEGWIRRLEDLMGMVCLN